MNCAVIPTLFPLFRYPYILLHFYVFKNTSYWLHPDRTLSSKTHTHTHTHTHTYTHAHSCRPVIGLILPASKSTHYLYHCSQTYPFRLRLIVYTVCTTTILLDITVCTLKYECSVRCRCVGSPPFHERCNMVLETCL